MPRSPPRALDGYSSLAWHRRHSPLLRSVGSSFGSLGWSRGGTVTVLALDDRVRHPADGVDLLLVAGLAGVPPLILGRQPLPVPDAGLSIPAVGVAGLMHPEVVGHVGLPEEKEKADEGEDDHHRPPHVTAHLRTLGPRVTEPTERSVRLPIGRTPFVRGNGRLTVFEVGDAHNCLGAISAVPLGEGRPVGDEGIDRLHCHNLAFARLRSIVGRKCEARERRDWPTEPPWWSWAEARPRPSSPFAR